MNKTRRAALTELLTRLEDIKAALEDIQGEEQDYYDAMPEALQGGEKGDVAQLAIDGLQAASDALDEATCGIETACE